MTIIASVQHRFVKLIIDDLYLIFKLPHELLMLDLIDQRLRVRVFMGILLDLGWYSVILTPPCLACWLGPDDLENVNGGEGNGGVF